MNLEIHYGEEWAALYVDGKLYSVGNSYIPEEHAFELLGVKRVHDDAFMQGQTAASGVAPTLTAVRAYADARHLKSTKADALRAQAAKLIAQADALGQ